MSMSDFRTPEGYRGVVSKEDSMEGPLPEAERAKVPFAMQDYEWVPKERYYDRGFYELEKKYLWSKTWQMAARLEEIPHPGDYTEYEIAGMSLLLVRQKDGGVKALHNACRHRATELARGCGRFPGGQITCPFHGWRWSTDGSPSYVYMEESFNPETLDRKDLALQEAKVEIWAGMIWINLDANARPLAEHLDPVMKILDPMGVGNMRVKWWKRTIVNANWKIAQEAFFEGYHVGTTHPQLQMGAGEEASIWSNHRAEYTAWKGGHGRFQFLNGEAVAYLGDDPRGYDRGLERFIEFGKLMADGQDGMVVDRDVHAFESVRSKVDPNDPSGAAKAIMALFEYAKGANIPMPEMKPEVMRLWGGDVQLFPNYLMLPMYGNCLAYRARPYNDDPEWCEFDVYSLVTYPVGEEPEKAELAGTYDKDDIEHWGLIPRQDFSNIEGQQRGLHTHSYTANRLSSVFEKAIANNHHEIDRYIARGLTEDAQ